MFSKAQQPQQTPLTKAQTPFFKPEPTFKSLATEQQAVAERAPESVMRLPIAPSTLARFQTSPTFNTPSNFKHQTSNLPIQAKLTVGQPNDKYEQEADAMADKVVQRWTMPHAVAAIPTITPFNINTAQRACAACEKEDKNHIQRKESGEMTASPSVESRLSATKGGGSSLPESTRSHMESAIGADFSNVRVHTGGEAVQLSQDLSAHAFTHGSDVYFNSGKFAPDTEGGRHLLAHELTHTVQQRSGSISTIRRAEVEDKDSVCSSLRDIKPTVNTFVNRIIAAARVSPGISPIIGFITEVLSHTGGSGAVGPIETFIEGLATNQRFIPNASLSNTRYSTLPGASSLGIPSVNIPGVGSLNIYNMHSAGFAHVVGAAAKINSICVGADKLGHFFQQGAQYLGVALMPGNTTANAESFGRATEIDRAGLGATGVFSNADLAANLAGLQFWRDLVANPSGFTFDIASYINNNWNEYANPNFYESSIAEHVWSNQLTGFWLGSTGLGPALSGIDVTLSVNRSGVVSGSFRPSSSQPQPPVTPLLPTPTPHGTISGALTFNTTSVTGNIPSTVLHGSSGTHSATPVSSITINFDWTMGLQSGKGLWNSNGEHQLRGSWGNGNSRGDKGMFNIFKS